MLEVVKGRDLELACSGRVLKVVGRTDLESEAERGS